MLKAHAAIPVIIDAIRELRRVCIVGVSESASYPGTPATVGKRIWGYGRGFRTTKPDSGGLFSLTIKSHYSHRLVVRWIYMNGAI